MTSEVTARQVAALQRVTALAGLVTQAFESAYRVRFRSLIRARGRGVVFRSVLVVLANVVFEAGFVVWPLAPSLRPDVSGEWPTVAEIGRSAAVTEDAEIRGAVA